MTSDGLLDHCLELLSAAGRPRSRRMFGGHGVYLDDLFVAIVVSDRLYLKTDDLTRPRFEAAGSQPFVYSRQGGEQAVMAYWTAPEEAMDAPDTMLPWARLALGAALRARQAQDDKLRKRKPPGPRKAAASSASAAAKRRASVRPKR